MGWPNSIPVRKFIRAKRLLGESSAHPIGDEVLLFTPAQDNRIAVIHSDGDITHISPYLVKEHFEFIEATALTDILRSYNNG